MDIKWLYLHEYTFRVSASFGKQPVYALFQGSRMRACMLVRAQARCPFYCGLEPVCCLYNNDCFDYSQANAHGRLRAGRRRCTVRNKHNHSANSSLWLCLRSAVADYPCLLSSARSHKNRSRQAHSIRLHINFWRHPIRNGIWSACKCRHHGAAHS